MTDLNYIVKTASSKKTGLLQRPRIDEKLSVAIKYPVVTVVAGAGYGKTQAVSMFLNKTPSRVMWLQLTELDNQLAKFWEEFIHAASLFNKGTALLLGQSGFPDCMSKFNQFLHILANDIYDGEQIILVLDNYHLMQDETILNFIDRLICAELENFCMILISRKKLVYHSSRILTHDLLYQITSTDLQFTLEETKELLYLQDITLSDQEYQKIQDYIEGWPFALYLVSLSLKEKKDLVTDKLLSSALTFIFDKIETDIFSKYPAEVQDFFIRLSLLNSFPKGLIRVLTDGNPDYILKLIQENTFISYNSHSKNYNFHALFLNYLRTKQIILTEQEIKDTYAKTAKWCINNDQLFDALEYYSKSKNYEEIWNIIIANSPLIVSKSATEMYLRLTESFPEEFTNKNPMVHVVHAGLLLNNAQLQPALKELTELRKKLESEPDTQENRIILGEIYNTLGLLDHANGNLDFTWLFKKASECLPNGGILYNTSKSVSTRYAMYLQSPAPGELEKMEKAYFYAMPYAAVSMNGFAYGFEYLASAEAAYFTGDILKASRNAYEAVYRGREKNVYDVASSAYFLLMRIAAMKGDYNGIITLLDQLKAYAKMHEKDQEFNEILDIAEGWFYATVGHTSKIAGWIMDDSLSRTVVSPLSLGMDRLVKAKCLLKDDKNYEMLNWVKSLETIIRKNNIWLILLDILTMKAVALHRIHNDTQAIDTLQEAYGIAKGNALISQFVICGKDMSSIIQTARQWDHINIPAEWMDNIESKSNIFAKRKAFIAAEYNKNNLLSNQAEIQLTKREKEILTNVYQGLTREEIAENLFVSTSAVKSTLNSIYAKLGALNSIDAIRIALQKQII